MNNILQVETIETDSIVKLLHHIVTPYTTEILQSVFEHNGYIAGGFATLLARHLLIDHTADAIDSFAVHVRSHLCYPQPNSEFACFTPDIDVWFSNVEDWNSFKNWLDAYQQKYNLFIFTFPSKAHWALECIVKSDARFQFINKAFAEPIQQISTFDIFNACVVVFDKAIMVPCGWRDYESRRELHVHNWQPHTFTRLNKWLRKRIYNRVSPETGNMLYSCLERELEKSSPQFQIEGKKYDDIGKFIADCRTYSKDKCGKKMHAKLLPFLHALTNEQLLFVTSLFPTTIDYDIITKEIMKRGYGSKT